MAFTADEYKLVEDAVNQGKTIDEAFAMLDARKADPFSAAKHATSIGAAPDDISHPQSVMTKIANFMTGGENPGPVDLMGAALPVLGGAAAGGGLLKRFADSKMFAPMAEREAADTLLGKGFGSASPMNEQDAIDTLLGKTSHNFGAERNASDVLSGKQFMNPEDMLLGRPVSDSTVPLDESAAADTLMGKKFMDPNQMFGGRPRPRRIPTPGGPPRPVQMAPGPMSTTLDPAMIAQLIKGK